MLENQEVLKAIAVTTIYPLEVIKITFSACQSFDDTILLCEMGAMNNCTPLTMYNAISRLGISVKDYYTQGSRL